MTPPDAAHTGGSGTQERPETGDLVIDAALSDLDSTPEEDLDAFITSGEAVHQTLKARLTDLGG